MLAQKPAHMTDTRAATNPSLAAVAICKNEERNLPGFLANLSGLVDEIVIVDDQSTDRSAEISRASGEMVTYVSHAMTEEGGFAGQRNRGIEASTADWLLHMDCDERVSPELASEIRSVLAGSQLNAFRYRRLNHFLNRPMRHGGWAGWNQPQLARRGRHHFEGRLHEVTVVDGGDASTGQLSAYMYHLNEGSFAERLEKSAKYVDMTAIALIEEGVRVSGAKIFWRTFREFLKRYVIQRGFLCGTPGLISAMHSATSEFRARALVWDKQNRVLRQEFGSEMIESREE